MQLPPPDDTESRLMLLYFLSCLEYDPPHEQLNRVFAEQGWLGWFDLQNVIANLSLCQPPLLQVLNTPAGRALRLTAIGRETVELFASRLAPSLRDRLAAYAGEHGESLKRETELLADYAKLAEHEYLVNCRIVEGGRDLLSLTLQVASGSQAREICKAWPTRAGEIYRSLLFGLLEEEKKEGRKDEP